MIIVHVASYRDEFFNGIKSVLQELIPEQRKLGHEVYVLNHSFNEREIIAGERFISSKRDFIETIEQIRPNLVIFHSLYGLDDVRFSWYLNKKKIPYLVEPHGGTSIENAKKSWFKKKVANLLYANKFIAKAAGLIYLNNKEADECVFKKQRKNYAVIPNGTHIHKNNKAISVDGKIRFMFLARIDIIQKGLDLLFPAIETFNRSGLKEKAEFHFYGKARNPQYANEFEQYVNNASDNVFFHGPAMGMDKEVAFQNADIFILPSRYEGMPMAVLEALSYGLPCILSLQTNMADIIESGKCGWVTEVSIEGIANSISRAIKDYEQKKDFLTENAMKACREFSWDAIAVKSIKEYSRIV